MSGGFSPVTRLQMSRPGQARPHPLSLLSHGVDLWSHSPGILLGPSSKPQEPEQGGSLTPLPSHALATGRRPSAPLTRAGASPAFLHSATHLPLVSSVAGRPQQSPRHTCQTHTDAVGGKASAGDGSLGSPGSSSHHRARLVTRGSQTNQVESYFLPIKQKLSAEGLQSLQTDVLQSSLLIALVCVFSGMEGTADPSSLAQKWA